MLPRHVQNFQLDHIALQARAIVDKAKQANRGLTGDERIKFDKLVADHTLIEAQIQVENLKHSNRLDGLANNLEALADIFRSNPKTRDDSPEARTFSKYLRGGAERLSKDELPYMRFMPHDGGEPVSIKNAQTETTTGGGYIIPQGFSGQLEIAKKWFGGIKGVVGEFFTTTGNALPWPTVNDVANHGRIVGINTQVTETDVVFGQVTFNAYVGSSDIVLIPLALIDDSFFDLDALCAELLGIRMGRLYNFYCTQGTGVNQPTGILTAAVNAGLTVSLSNDALGYWDLTRIESAVDPAYRESDKASWMFPDGTLTLLKQLVDANARPLWQPGLTASFREGAPVDPKFTRPLILGHPYYVNSDMQPPVSGVSTASILFGDMSKFKVRRVGRQADNGGIMPGITMMRLTEKYMDYLQLGIMAYDRFDANLVDGGTTPVAVGVMAS